MDRPYDPKIDAVHVVDVEGRVVPDNSFNNAFAIYLNLTVEPRLVWEEAFDHLLELETGGRRIVSFVGPKMRVVVSTRDDLETICKDMAELVERTNARMKRKTPHGGDES